MAGIKEKLRQVFDKLSPQKKRIVIVGVLLIALILVALTGYKLRGRGAAQAEVNTPHDKQDISLDPNLIARTQLAEAEKAKDEQGKKILDLEKEVENIKKQRESDSEKERSMPSATTRNPAMENHHSGLNGVQAHDGVPSAGASGITRYPPVPPPPASAGGYRLPDNPGNKAVSESQVIGGIEIASNTTPDPASSSEEGKSEDKKKEPRKVFLPTGSFMAGTLLSGLDAPVMEGAKKDPIPVLLRINDLAVLPNEVKGNLRGCFVVAHGYGDLASERAELKLVALSCLSKKGEAVIDQPVSGFVVDADGKIGLAGKVVAKLGSLIARSAVAGFFAGVGDFLKASTTTTQVTAAGPIQTIDTSKLATAGIGGGLSTAASDLSKFYMELARMSMPVIEIGATRNITIVVSQGIDLEIKEKKRVAEK